MTEERITASVIVCAFNEEKNIGCCIESLLVQDFKDFELIIVDDASCDNTKAAVEKYADPRIKYYRNNKNLGPAGARNVGLSHAKGDYIFFTDADCVPMPNWISSGLKCLESAGCIGAQGVTLPDKPSVTAADRVVSSENNKYQTCNVAYRKDILEKVGGFDEYLRVGEDLDLGYSAARLGDICKDANMIVIHKTQKWELKSALLYAWRCGRGMVYIINKHKINARVLYPKQFAALIFPPALLIYHACRSFADFKVMPLLYLRLLVLRLAVWTFAFRNRILLF
jgi:glycosyltransferase involved in cell wall biosynthesis